MLRRMLPTTSLRSVLLLSLGMAAYSGLAVWKEHGRFSRFADFPSGLEATLSLVIGLLLAFRANRAFDRWWEGRTLWGTLVNASRNLAVKANNVIVERDKSLPEMERLLVAFPYALRDHLRDGARLNKLPGMSSEQADPRHVPSWIVNNLYGLFEAWKQQRWIQYGEFRVLDREAKVLLEVCGGCERIKNTPIARSYRVFLHQTLALFLLTLPWGIVNDFEVWTIPIVFLISYLVLAAEGIAHHVEQPFGTDDDALDLDGICREIETSVREILQTDSRKHTSANRTANGGQ